MRISDWSSDVCSSDLDLRPPGDIGEVLLDAAPVLAQLQDAAELFVGHIDGGVDPPLLAAVYMDRVGHVGRIVKLLPRPVVHEHVVDHRWSRGDEVDVLFTAEPFLNDLQIQEASEAAANTDAAPDRGPPPDATHSD